MYPEWQLMPEATCAEYSLTTEQTFVMAYFLPMKWFLLPSYYSHGVDLP